MQQQAGQQHHRAFPEPAAQQYALASASAGLEPFQHSQQEVARHGERHRGGCVPLTQTMLPNEENDYLRKNLDYVRHEKHRLEEKLHNLETRLRGAEAKKHQYKMLYEQARQAASHRGGGELELSSLHEQLSAVNGLKEVFHHENLELSRRLEEAEKAGGKEACVICMDNLANMVCLPCKHLALCAFCGQQQDVRACPICRTPLEDKMQIFMP